MTQSLADDARGHGHLVTARKAYLRASEYWRQSFFFIRHDLDDDRLQHAWRQHRHAFRSALLLLDYQTVSTEIPFDGAAMTGYLFRPADDDVSRPTVVAPCGFDSTAEAGYGATGYMALPRGYNFFVFEGPGQGGMLFEHRRTFRPDFEVPFGAAFDWLLAQNGVDPDSVAVIGRSFGGYLGPRAAAFEPRVAALVADPGQYDFASRVGLLAKGLSSGSPEDFLARLRAADPDLDAQLQGAIDGPRNLEWYGSRMAAMGGTRVGDFIRHQLTFTLDGVAAHIRCPTLVTEGEGDFASQSALLYDQLRCEKELKQFTEAQGAGGHCEGLGATLFEGYAFDWLDEVLSRRPASRAPTGAT
ncbi:MAG TPA: alpha/beta hydrolase [Mycobacterium sp.]|nr:alpha/beta hydrolase [Mycobacterium sp.]